MSNQSLLVLPLTAVMLFAAVGIEGESRLALPELDQKAPSILWRQTVPLPLLDPCLSTLESVESRGVSVGPDDDVVAVGILASLSTVVVVKYDGSSGERVWCTSLPIKATTPTGTTFLVASAEIGGVAIDSDGTIFIGGHGGAGPLPPLYSAKPGPPLPMPAIRYFVTKCSSVGMCASAVTFINPSLANSHNDTIGGIAVGPDGQPVLTGLAEFPASKTKATFKLLTVKVNGSTLSLLGTAQASSNTPSKASAQGVAVDSSNDIFVTGTEASTLKYDSSLSPTPLWTFSLAGARLATGPRHDGDDDPRETHEVAVLRTGANRGFAITKLDSETGATLWTRTYGSGLIEIPSDLAMDHSGNTLVSGDQGQLVSLSRTGELNWTDVFPASSFSAVTVGLDDAPVVSGYSEAAGGRPRVMTTLRYNSSAFEVLQASAIEKSDHKKGPRHNKLAWDEPISETVAGFLVCIDEKEKAEPVCQDVGSPANLNPRVLGSTTPGSLTYEIALSRLASLTSGKRRMSVVAYNNSGDSPESPALFVAGHFGQHTFDKSPHEHDDDHRSR